MINVVSIGLTLYDVSYAVGRIIRLGWPYVLIAIIVLVAYWILKGWRRRK